MNISPLLSPLTQPQREAFKECLSLIQNKKKIKQSDIDNLIDDNHCTGLRVCGVFDITKMSLCRWVDDGCPRNPDKSYSLAAVIKWRIDKFESKAAKPTGLKDEKTQQEIELLKARIDKERQLNIPRSLHETILISRMGTLRSFLEKTFMSNAVYLAGKTVDEVRTSLYKLVQSAMQAYAGNAEDE